jgi:glutamine synthetase
MMDETHKDVEAFLAAHPDVDMFEVVLPDMSGGLRGKWITRDKLPTLFRGGLKLPLSAVAFDTWGRDVTAWVFDSGDGDGYARPEPRTLAPVPWAPGTGQVVISLVQPDRSPCSVDPRTLLARLVERLAQRGLTPVVATEMEFYLLKAGSDRLGRPEHTQKDRVGGALGSGETYGIETMAEQREFMRAVYAVCAAQNLPVDTLIKESAPSQYEINLYHRADALAAADEGMLLQRAIRCVARERGLRACFMAKPFGGLAGNGMHMHCSLLDAAGENVFADAQSPALRQAIAGCLDSMADYMLLFAPHLNSFRRFTGGSHAPLAPSWGFENRTVALRVPLDKPAATRIEHRVPGADAQPHLAIAAMLAGVLYGLEDARSAPEPMTGNAYEQLVPSLPRYLPDALQRFADSALVTEYFGADFQRVYTLLKEQELDEYDRHVTPIEYDASL